MRFSARVFMITLRCGVVGTAICMLMYALGALQGPFIYTLAPLGVHFMVHGIVDTFALLIAFYQVWNRRRRIQKLIDRLNRHECSINDPEVIQELLELNAESLDDFDENNNDDDKQ